MQRPDLRALRRGLPGEQPRARLRCPGGLRDTLRRAGPHGIETVGAGMTEEEAHATPVVLGEARARARGELQRGRRPDGVAKAGRGSSAGTSRVCSAWSATASGAAAWSSPSGIAVSSTCRTRRRTSSRRSAPSSMPGADVVIGHHPHVPQGMETVQRHAHLLQPRQLRLLPAHDAVAPQGRLLRELQLEGAGWRGARGCTRTSSPTRGCGLAARRGSRRSAHGARKISRPFRSGRRPRPRLGRVPRVLRHAGLHRRK